MAARLKRSVSLDGKRNKSKEETNVLLSPPTKLRKAASTPSKESPNRSILDMFHHQQRTELSLEVVECPCCEVLVQLSHINAHLDRECLTKEQTCQTPDFLPVPLFSPKTKTSIGMECTSNAARILFPIPPSEPPSNVQLVDRLNESMPDANEPTQDIPDDATRTRTRYYEQYFNLMVTTVLDQSRHLFDLPEVTLLDKFWLLPPDAQRLFIRLSQRKPTWFRVRNLSYGDIGNVPLSVHYLVQANFFVNGESLRDIDAALNLLTVVELRLLARELQVNVRTSYLTKSELMESIQDQLRVQSVLVGSPRKSAIRKVLRQVGAVVGLSELAKQTMKRVELLFFLNSSYEEQTMRTLVLVGLDRIVYPRYHITRSRHVFPTRERLIEFEEAIRLEAKLVAFLENTGGPREVADRFRTQKWKRTPSKSTNDEENAEYASGLNDGPTRQRISDLCEEIATAWRKSIQNDAQDHESSYFLLRYSSTWVYTRAASLTVEVLEKLHKYDDVVQLLRELLGQQRYCLGSRGYWWDRLALDVERHLKQKSNVVAAICQAALEDVRLRTGHRFAIQKRLRRLLVASRKASPKSNNISSSLWSLLPQQEEDPVVHTTIKARIGVVGSAVEYVGCDGVLCRVEVIAMQYYLRLRQDGLLNDVVDGNGTAVETGWRGLHAENGILSTLFALLFWDVLFAPHPDVFQTNYQVAPLDLVTDAFYLTRRQAIDKRLEEIEAGKGSSLIAAVDDQQRGVMCVGVSWNMFSKQTLIDIAECLGGLALSCICRLFCEDYRHRSSGMPDLVLWHVEWKRCRFVEVKSTNDRLSDRQNVWLEALLRAGVDAQVCHVDGARRFEQPTVAVPDETQEASTENEPPHDLQGLLQSLQAGSTTTFDALLVGHRFCCLQAQQSPLHSPDPCCAHLQPGRVLNVQREHDNVADPNAVQIQDALEQKPIGHIPRKLAGVLAPLLDQGTLTLSGVVRRRHGQASAMLALTATVI